MDRCENNIKMQFRVKCKHHSAGSVDVLLSVSCEIQNFVKECIIELTGNGKVKVKLKFTLEHAMKAQRRSRGIALLFP